MALGLDTSVAHMLEGKKRHMQQRRFRKNGLEKTIDKKSTTTLILYNIYNDLKEIKARLVSF